MVVRDIITYDTKVYDFRGEIQKKVDFLDIENIHHTVNYDIFTLENDQSSKYHKRFYKNCDLDSDFDALYRRFVKEQITKYFNCKDIIYQKRPTFRIHYNGNLAVGEFHRDSDYNHPKDEVNFFLPVTRCWDTNTIWIESETDKADYSPVSLEYGEVFVFSGGALTHGNRVNSTGTSRISVDFRCLVGKHPKALSSLGVSGKANKKFVIGDYYEKL